VKDVTIALKSSSAADEVVRNADNAGIPNQRVSDRVTIRTSEFKRGSHAKARGEGQLVNLTDWSNVSSVTGD
jgi:hypothetical protein